MLLGSILFCFWGFVKLPLGLVFWDVRRFVLFFNVFPHAFLFFRVMQKRMRFPFYVSQVSKCSLFLFIKSFFFGLIFGVVLGVILTSFREPFGIIFPQFLRSKNTWILGSTSGGLLEGFWRSRPSNGALAYTKRSFSKNYLFRVGDDF